MPREPFALKAGRLRLVPVCHYSMEFAWFVRRAILHFRPSALALELPSALGEAFSRAVARFPCLSVVSYRTRGGETRFLPVEPTDPLAEAVRTGREAGIPVHFVDLEVEGYPLYREPLPDSYALYAGLEAYWEHYDRRPRPRSELDRRREQHMAAALRELPGEVLLVCGMAHARPVLEAFQGEERGGKVPPSAGAPIAEVVLAHPDLDSIREIAGEMPFLTAVYEWFRGGPGPDETWADPEPQEESRPVSPSPLQQMTGQDAVAFLEAVLGGRRSGGKPLPPSVRRAAARYLLRLRDPGLRLPGQGPAPPPELSGAPPPERPRIFKFRSVADRRSQLRQVYAAAAQDLEADGFPDRHRLLLRLFRVAADFYRENTGETIQRWQERTLVQFARNYARVTGRLLPDLYQCVVVARGAADDNYAYEVWDLASFYPWSGNPGALPTIRVRAGEVWLGEKKLTFRRRFPRLRERLTRLPLRRRPDEEHPGDWVREFQRGTICSYPPEDVVIENFGRYLQKKALRVLSEERTRVEEFTARLLDGIDLRETLRRWPEGGRLYVRECQRVRGGAGSVVLIFDEDPSDARFPWKMTWHGEHDQESDMAFYSTPAHHKVVGPGIARCEYGGLMLTYPPGRLLDVWSDPMYHEARTKPEVLLMAALDYSEEKHVVYVAAHPPRSWFRTFAGRLGKKIVYLPLGQLSPVSLKKIRVFHVLSGHHLREIARNYIW